MCFTDKSQEETNNCRALIKLPAANLDDLNQKRGIIYKITNKINGKCYIGRTHKTFRGRYVKNDWANYKHNKRFNKEKQQFGIENFKIEILLNNLSRPSLWVWEQFYIKLYKSLDKNFGYNIDPPENVIKNLNKEPSPKLSQEEFIIKLRTKSQNYMLYSWRILSKSE